MCAYTTTGRRNGRISNRIGSNNLTHILSRVQCLSASSNRSENEVKKRGNFRWMPIVSRLREVVCATWRSLIIFIADAKATKFTYESSNNLINWMLGKAMRRTYYAPTFEDTAWGQNMRTENIILHWENSICTDKNGLRGKLALALVQPV